MKLTVQQKRHNARIEKGLCTQCNKKAVTKRHCEYHRWCQNQANARRHARVRQEKVVNAIMRAAIENVTAMNIYDALATEAQMMLQQTITTEVETLMKGGLK